jgi:ABC-type uncharacterized transport system permease subunit
LAIDMVMLVVWTLVFFVASKWIYRRGLERYSGFGG